MRSFGRSIAVNIWFDYFQNEHIDLSLCGTVQDNSQTMDKIELVGFGEVMNSPGQLRYLDKNHTAKEVLMYIFASNHCYKLGNVYTKSLAITIAAIAIAALPRSRKNAT